MDDLFNDEHFIWLCFVENHVFLNVSIVYKLILRQARFFIS